MGQLLSFLVPSIAPTAIGVITCAVIASATILYQAFSKRLSYAAQRQISDLAGTVVKAIEQKYEQLGPGGMQKKQEAMTILQSLCRSLKLPLSDTHASIAIEAAVYAMNLYQKIRADEQEPKPTTKTDLKLANTTANNRQA